MAYLASENAIPQGTLREKPFQNLRDRTTEKRLSENTGAIFED